MADTLPGNAMTDPKKDPLEAILRLCAAVAPAPWYPRDHPGGPAAREPLEPAIEQLRVAGLIRLTEWVAEHGQGYELTIAGSIALEVPEALEALRVRLAPPQPGQTGPPPRRVRPAAPEEVRNPPPTRVTHLILLVNVVVFALTWRLAMQQGIPQDRFLEGNAPAVAELLHRLGALRGTDLLRGEWWRLLTSCFLHFGAGHLVINMVMLYSFGPLMEGIWGRFRFLVLYLLSGVIGGIGAVLLHPTTLGAGASGALFGVPTSLAVWMFLHRHELSGPLKRLWTKQLIFILALNTGMTFLFARISRDAHLGGALGGLVLALPLNYVRARAFWARGLAWLAVAAVPTAAVAALVIGVIPSLAVWRTAAEKAEREVLEGEVLPVAGKFEDEALQAWNREVKDVLEQHPARREERLVKQAREVLAEGRTGLQEALRLLERAGPYRTASVEGMRQARRDHLRETERLFEVCASCLEAGPAWTAADEGRLQAQNRRTRDAKVRWQELRQR